MSRNNSTQQIYEGQKFTLILDAGRELDTSSTFVFKCLKPDGNTTELNTTIVSDTAGTVAHEFTTGELTPNGQWIIKIYDTLNDILGQNYYLYVDEEFEK